MGAKLSKKKKGYCLGAGKDGESTETTEVEQKETEIQAGQKDAAEPNGEKNPTDQTPNGASDEQKAQAENTSTEVPSGETTKDDSNKDQKSESKPSSEETKELNQEQEPIKSPDTTQQTALEGGKEVDSQPQQKPHTDHDKQKESEAKDEPVKEPETVKEQTSEPEQQNQTVTKPSAPVPEPKEVAKSIPDPEIKVEVEKMEQEQTPVTTSEHVSEQAMKPVSDSLAAQEKLPEPTEQLVTEATSVDPVVQKPLAPPEAELSEPANKVVEPEPANKVVEPEPANKVVEPEPTEVSLPETVPATDLVKPEPDLAPEPVTKPVPVMESVASKVSEQPVAPVPKVEIVEPEVNPELVPCPEPEQVSEIRHSLPELPPSNEVPDFTTEVVENAKNRELDTESLETQAAPSESAPAQQPSDEKINDQSATVAENGPSEQDVENLEVNKVQDTISTEQDVADKEMHNEVKDEESISDKPTDQDSLQKEKDCKAAEEVALDTSKNENDQAISEDTTVHDATQEKKSEDKAENHEMPAELSNEPSAPLIVDKHGVGNGLPLKEDVKVHLENGCDKDLHELNGQGGGHEIEVSNE
ncbi:cell surface glycoprotein 1-like [Bufo gargarizans]|uniref:cell surface glycoprotein 1-like n=1 Tax=Bufo gargarizans TaxID=30331 RepID=UPI001CF42A7A|nr:cell surface glycoprotein 1-like [Bufo gargarizans]